MKAAHQIVNGFAQDLIAGRDDAPSNDAATLEKFPYLVWIERQCLTILICVNIENIDVQLTVFHKIVKEDLSVRKTEDLVRKIDKISSGKEVSKAGVKELSIELKNLQTVLSSHFGTKVEIQQKSGQKGDIKIPYMSVDDLNRILEILEIQL